MTTSAASCPFTFTSCHWAFQPAPLEEGRQGGGSHPHALLSAWPHRCSVSLRRRRSWGLCHGLEGYTQSPESRARSRQRKRQSFLVDVAEEGCPPLHLWFHRHGIRQLWAGTIEKKILSLLDIRRFLPFFILSSYSLKPAVWQLSQSVCIVLGMFHKDEPTFRGWM